MERTKSGEQPILRPNNELANTYVLLLKDCIGNVIKLLDAKKSPTNDEIALKARLEEFACTQDMELLLSPLYKDGPKVTTALDNLGDEKAWHELVGYAYELKKLRPIATKYPAKQQSGLDHPATGTAD